MNERPSLAILPDADGLSGEQMQQIAREFNFSESTFVMTPRDVSHTKQVRIFTPTSELPFAGHPNIGTAYALAALGKIPLSDEAPVRVQFEEAAGLVPITIASIGGMPRVCELEAPQPLCRGTQVPNEEMAAALSLQNEEIVTDTHAAIVASVGLAFFFVEVSDASALSRSCPPRENTLCNENDATGILLYTRDNAGLPVDLNARMYAPGEGIVEDPATGSANCALGALLASYDEMQDGEFVWRVAQGVDMGRPSMLQARAIKSAGTVTSAYIGGNCVMVADGFIEI